MANIRLIDGLRGAQLNRCDLVVCQLKVIVLTLITREILSHE